MLQRSPGEWLCVQEVISESGMVTAGTHWSEERVACGPMVGSLL